MSNPRTTRQDAKLLAANVSRSRKLAELSSDSVRLLWTWLLPHCDEYGNFYGEPDLVRGTVVPRLKHWDDEKIKKALMEMVAKGLILAYSVDGEHYIHIDRWEDFQSFRADRDRKNIFPTSTCDDTHLTPTSHPLVTQESPRTELNRTELNRTEQKHKNVDNNAAVTDVTTEEDESMGIAAVLASRLSTLILSRDPKAKVNPSEWAVHIERLHRIDKREWDEIAAVIDWCQQDEFWQANILSGKKLREKFTQLVAAKKRTVGEPKGFAGIRAFAAKAKEVEA